MINLLYLAVAMAAGLALSRLMKLVNLPNVTGYLIAGILVGPYVLNIINTESIESLKIITSTALGFVAFSIGGEFKLSYLKKLGKSIVVITVVQALVTVLLVAGVMLLIPGEKSVKVPRALLLGAISAATAPAATIMVIKQYRAKGPVTETLLSVVAIDDATALILFSLAVAVAQALSNGAASLGASLLSPLKEIGGALVVGAALGFVFLLYWLFKKKNVNTMKLILLVIALSVVLSFLGIM